MKKLFANFMFWWKEYRHLPIQEGELVQCRHHAVCKEQCPEKTLHKFCYNCLNMCVQVQDTDMCRRVKS